MHSSTERTNKDPEKLNGEEKLIDLDYRQQRLFRSFITTPLLKLSRMTSTPLPLGEGGERSEPGEGIGICRFPRRQLPKGRGVSLKANVQYELHNSSGVERVCDLAE